MIAKAIARFVRISPRKTRLVADMVRGKSIDEAQTILMNVPRRPRLYVREVLNSAIANATRKDPDISLPNLYISRITIDAGPMFKRYRAGSMGRAMMIKHRMSHILIELDRKKETVKKIEDTKKKSQITRGKLQVKGKKLTTNDKRLTTKKLATAKRGK